MQDRPLRADARRSRESIVGAFLALGLERGADVPMYEVAKRAGVGQGTLYRHFPDRTALVAAVFEGEIDGLEQLAATLAGAPDALLRLLDAATKGQARLHGLSEVLIRGDASGDRLRLLAARNSRLFEAPLADAVAAGLVRTDTVLADVVAVMSMMEGMLIGIVSVADRSAAVERGMRIALGGLLAPVD